MNHLNLGAILSDRYRILKKLGEGGFGNTYLAEDLNRFNEACVLKEFAPKLQGTAAIAKAQELFQREAGILYQLQHPQIPQFRELFKVTLSGKQRLFLVQDYVEGENYRHLLQARQRQGRLFSEAEVTQLLMNILPVLSYIHTLGVIHRDISPENLMLRHSDHLPILIDFGGVKQIEATVESQILHPGAETALLTRLGKTGYAPDEQLNRGLVFPHSDLFALAVTVLVLLTGKEPNYLVNPHTLEWEWQSYLTLSPTLTALLQKMLAKLPGERFQSAAEVLQALHHSATVASPAPVASNPPVSSPPPPQTSATVVVNPQVSPPAPSSSASPPTPTAHQGSDWFVNTVIILVLAGVSGLIGWYVGNGWMQSQQGEERNPPTEIVITPAPEEELEEEQNYSPEELKRKQELFRLRRDLGIEYTFYVALVNQFYWQEYPEQQGVIPSKEPEDAPWREKWDAIAKMTLTKLEFLSSSARQGLGSYNSSQRQNWIQEANQLHLSSKALFDLADGEFFAQFPNQTKLESTQEPMGQIWYGIVFDQLQDLKSGQTYRKLQFPPDEIAVTMSRQITPDKGQVYVAKLKAGQIMTVALIAEPETLLSIYTPTGKQSLLEDSPAREWTGTLPETGYYEFVIVSQTADASEIQLELNVADLSEEEPEEPIEPEEPTEEDIIIEPIQPPFETPSEPPVNEEEGNALESETPASEAESLESESNL